MTVYDYLKMNECDEDFWDDQFDTCVTICCPDMDDDSWINKFTWEISKHAEVIKTTEPVLAGWTAMIERNWEKFKEFTKANWEHDYEDKDDFIYEWINEIHMYIAGYMPEDYYEVLYNFAKELK